jgi:UDP-N-acetylmuramate--alanine ligase
MMKLGRARRFHFIGIGGSGMSGIAEVLLNLGYRVSGSDVAASRATERLASLGAKIHVGHAPDAVAGADVVVVSSAIPEHDPERLEAVELRVPVIPRAEMLGELMRLKTGVAVAGSHGKTSTTSMLATVLTRSGLDPTVVIGGRLEIYGSSAKLGSGELLVAEADESDGSFVRLFPTIAVVTGIDREHVEHYGDLDALHDAFVGFLARVPFYGAIVACLDDSGVQAILPRIDRRVVTYGVTHQADLRAGSIHVDGFSTSFELYRGSEHVAPVRLATPGEHQVLNALAALLAADELGVSLKVAAAAIEDFPGAERRMQRRGERAGVLVVDDYGHHPREIAAALSALRAAIGERRLVVLFQPHRYSRLAALFDEFATCFYRADSVRICELYAAGEAPIEGLDAERLARAIAEHGHRDARFVGALDDAVAATADDLRSGDVVLTLGAGSIGRAPDALLERLEERGNA